MSIKEKWKGFDGIDYILEYENTNSFENLDYSLCRQCYGVCFYKDKMVIGYRGKKKVWGLVGGTIEKGENFEECLRREIKEETNMEVLNFLPIGYQTFTGIQNREFGYQLRYVCKVRPLGPFVSDPAGSITEIKLIDPKEYKKFFDWGKIHEKVIERALELKDLL